MSYKQTAWNGSLETHTRKGKRNLLTELIRITKYTCVNLLPHLSIVRIFYNQGTLWQTKNCHLWISSAPQYTMSPLLNYFSLWLSIDAIKKNPRRLSKRKEVKLMLNDAYLLCLMRDGCCVKCGEKKNKNKQSQSVGALYNGRNIVLVIVLYRNWKKFYILDLV